MIAEETETLLDVQHSPLFLLKRKGLVLTLFVFYFLSGLEYSLTVPPSLADGKISLDDRAFMLTEVGLYPLAAMIAAPIVGHIYDRTKRIRTVLITLAFLEITGNLLYAIKGLKWLSLIGRFICGLGDGFIPLSVGEITYLYEDHDRHGILTFFEFGRVIGFLNGPVVIFFINKWTTGDEWKASYRTIPGYVMGWGWAFASVMAFFCLHNLALEIIDRFNLNDSPFLSRRTRIYHPDTEQYEDVKEENIEDDRPGTNPFTDDEDTTNIESGSEPDSLLGPDYGEPEAEIEEISETEGKKSVSFQTDDEAVPPPKPLKHRIESARFGFLSGYGKMKESFSDNSKEVLYNSHIGEICYPEIILLLIITFVVWYSQTSFMIFCGYIITNDLGWGPIPNGLTYVTGFVVVLLFFLAMYGLRQCLAKNSMYFIIIALACIQISLAVTIYEPIPTEKAQKIAVFMIAAGFTFLSIPFTLVCLKGLITTLVRPGVQGTLQGIATAIVRLAIISGLLLSVITVHNRQVYASVMTAFCFISLVLFFLSHELVKKRQKESVMKFSY